MPEGPECRHISDQLAAYLTGKRLDQITIRSGRYQRHGPPKGYAAVTKCLPVIIEAVGVKGKFIYLSLSHDWYLWNTLGMSGQWILNQTSTPPDQHCHVALVITDLQTNQTETVYFRDVRNFGTLQFVRGYDNLTQKLSKIGPDILSNVPLTREDWLRIVKKNSTWTLPKFLMNQAKVAGIGNYLKAEALYEANLSPLVPISEYCDDALWYLYIVTREIAKRSYATRGASFLTYVDANGVEGGFTFKVYREQTDPYGNIVSRDPTDDGRTTWWVGSTQC